MPLDVEQLEGESQATPKTILLVVDDRAEKFLQLMKLISDFNRVLYISKKASIYFIEKGVKSNAKKKTSERRR